MGEISTGISISTALNKVENRVSLNLKEQQMISARSSFERAQSIFTQHQTDFSSTEQNFFNKVFEEAVSQRAYKSLQEDLSILRHKERAFDNADASSTKKFIAHEQALQANPEIQEIETQIRDNKSEIQKKQKVLTGKTKSQNSYQNVLQASSLLKQEISQLQSSEMTLVTDIESIKSAIQQLKSGTISVSELQISVTGSTSSSAIDTGKLATSDSSSVAVLGGQQVSESKGLQDLLDNLKVNTNSSQKQEEIETKIKEAAIESLENLLSKEQQLKQTRKQLEVKESQLSKNQETVGETENVQDGENSEKTSLEQEIEELIQENLELVEERIQKDPELVKFSSFKNFFNNFLKGNGETGAGVAADLNRKKEDFSEIQEIFEGKSSNVNDFREILDIKSFLKNEAKANLSSSKLQTEEQQNLFETFKEKYTN